ncbi:16S rRNA (cytidine(1402)-2'-O)-methyltransferase [Bacillus sp. H-16]|uniref:16S rRNA (cytidine(1402)-2'-O)-methyltransferase n=1 Tax=Alteribacter salitolerans TaxID=2912333 RepID=UPI0019640C0C|nr:16S rRNA (cytidine(1402)-2'-O)-methyltransferase [Alteribacter salitolerans]MBM7098039.1 16S rRNA (cytidine(1402)-2'-O)-methyltransferase [Alteribacter salitolerans]
MFVQKSFKDQDEKGTLYLVPTPIGNLEDMTYRAVSILKEADLIAAEDTRNTKRLCHVFEIETKLVSYHEHNKAEREEFLIDKLADGSIIALVSDAGMPAISDPGQELVARCIEEKITVVPLPGANAAITGLIASGLSTDSFTFVGFLNRKKKIKRETLNYWKNHESTMIFYEAPHRITSTLKEMLETLGSRKAVLCRELTKRYEEFVRGTLKELLEHCEANQIKGECVLFVEGAPEGSSGETGEVWWETLDTVEHVKAYMEKGESSKDAIKQTAKDREMNKREVYKLYHTDGS